MSEQLWGWLLLLLAAVATLWYLVGVMFFMTLGLVSRRPDASWIERAFGFTRQSVLRTMGDPVAFDARWMRSSEAIRPELRTALKAHMRFAWALFVLAGLMLLLSLFQMWVMFQLASSVDVAPALWSVALGLAGVAAFFGTLWGENRRWDARIAPTWKVVQLGDQLFAKHQNPGLGPEAVRSCAIRLQAAVVGTLLDRRGALERLDWKVRLRQAVADWIACATDEVLTDPILLERWVGDACDLTSLGVPYPPAEASGRAKQSLLAIEALEEIDSSRLRRERPTHTLGAIFAWASGITALALVLAIVQQNVGSVATLGDMLASLGDDPLAVVTAVGSVAALAAPLLALIQKVVRQSFSM